MERITVEQLQQELQQLPSSRWSSLPLTDASGPPLRWSLVATIRLSDSAPPVELGLTEDANWVVVGSGHLVSLANTADLFRVFPLLELPLNTVRDSLRRQLRGVGLSETCASLFPFDEIIAAALTSRSSAWSELALEWASMSQPSDVLYGALDMVQQIGITQRQRHRARRLLAEWRE